jgi:diacylglycerol kinase family enzyme
MKRVLLIVNPRASEVTDGRIRAVERELGSVGSVATVRTERPGHATEVVRAWGDVDAIVVFSGDGGFNEAVNGADGKIPFGFVPGGRTNVLTRALGLSRNAGDAARVVADALERERTRRISLGRVNGRRFAFNSGIAFDAELVRRVEALGRSEDGRRAGDLAFLWTTARFFGERRARFEPVLEVRGLGRAAFLFVANTDPYTYVGAVAIHASRAARFELGLDVVGPVRTSALSLPRLFAYALTGRGQERAPDLLYGHDLDRIEVECDRPLPLQADGEDLGDVERALFECERDALPVLV